MTDIELLDHFAGLAMQGMVSSINDQESLNRLRRHANSVVGMTLSEFIADDAYKQAEAMIKSPRRAKYNLPFNASRGGFHCSG